MSLQTNLMAVAPRSSIALQLNTRRQPFMPRSPRTRLYYGRLPASATRVEIFNNA